MPRTAVSLLFLLLWVAGSLAAQVGTTTDVITGVVTGPAGEPLSGARVAATSVESGVTRATLTNAQGRFTLVFPDGGGRFRLETTYLGMGSTVQTVARLADEDVLVANVRMDVLPIALEGVEVTANRAPSPFQREPGSQERTLAGEALNRLPIDPGDLAAIATLAPGVVSVGSGDSLGLAISILGQGPAGNQVTLDGLSFGSAEGLGGGMGMGVPQEAVRFTRVITNTYDVARGQFSGGQIATTTRSGTNRLQGSFGYSMRDPALQWADASDPFAGALTLHRASGGVGGPIVRDRLFYFGSISAQRRSEGVQSLLSADAATLQRLGASPDSVGRFLSLVGARGLGAGGAVDTDRVGDVVTALGRLDLTLSERHTLTLRGDTRWFEQEGFRSGPLGLPQTGGNMSTSGAGAMATLTSRFGNGWINELRAYLSREDRETQPYAALPQGRVRVSSELEEGARGVTTLSFGGGANRTRSADRGAELSNELSLLLGSTHRVRLGGTLNWSRTSSESASNVLGTFTFNSLADFEANRPASFTRTLAPREREAGGWNAALFLGDTWRPSRRLQLAYGLRAEASRVALQPAHNPVVETLFGRRTDAIPGDLALSPRVGFSYTLGALEGGPPAGVIRGGFGEFRARPPWQLFASAREATGLPGTSSQLFCVGGAVPLPDWAAYLADPGQIPAACLEGGPAFAASGRGTGVTVFDPEFAAPRTWRGSLGAQRRIGRTLNLSADATYAVGVSQQGVRDLNLRPTPAFTLGREGGRPVFAPAQAIVPRTGEVGFLASRVHPEFGGVMEAHSDLRSRTAQLSLGLNGFVPAARMFFQGSYTLTRARDQGSAGGWGWGRFGGGMGGGEGSQRLAETAGDPNQPDWGTSDFERRHALTVTLGRPLAAWLDLSVIGRATSGTPYTPLVGGDINGDGARNDRAFVFDPSSADPELAGEMRRLLDEGQPGARECLAAQLGRIAERNACRGPWSYALDLRANLRPELPGLGRRLVASVNAVNTLAGLDRLLHGPDELRGWGQPIRPDEVLLYPRGFDPATQSFRYEVNGRFGSTRQGGFAFRNPFQVQIEARVSVGPAPAQGGPGGFRGMGGMGGPVVVGPGGGGGGGRTMLRNPIRGILELSDSLALRPEQVERLGELAGSLQAQQDSVSAAMAAARGAGNFQAMQPHMARYREAVARALEEARGILTPEQWSRVPESVRTPPSGGGGPRRRPNDP